MTIEILRRGRKEQYTCVVLSLVVSRAHIFPVSVTVCESATKIPQSCDE